MKREDYIFKDLFTINSVMSLKATSYYLSLYAFLLEEELYVVTKLKPQTKIGITIAANGLDTLRFVFFTGTEGKDCEIITVIEKPLTATQFYNFMRVNKG